MEKKNLVCIGGGTGTHTVLRGLKQYQKQLNLAAVVTMADSGGSTGRLRDEFGQLPVGDVRMALAALASDVDQHEDLLRKLFLYRFEKGDGLSGHNFGNLFLVALTEILGSEEKAIRAAGKVLRVQGRVLPVTDTPVDLVATYDDGVVVIGEHDIDEPSPDRHDKRIVDLSITPDAVVTERAEKAILDADLILLGPGDLYTSVLANIAVKGVSDAIRHSGATVVYVCNLMTKLGQTTDYSLTTHIDTVTGYLGKAPDVVLANDALLPADLLKKYKEEAEFPVFLDVNKTEVQVVSADLLASETVSTAAGDTLKRSLIRHDSRKLARQIMELL